MAIKRNYIKASHKKYSKFTLPDFSSGFDLTKDESVLSPAIAKECYNFDFSSGTLKDGYGVRAKALFEGIKVLSLYSYRRYDGAWKEYLLCYADDGAVYYTQDGDSEVTALGGISLKSKPSFISYRLNGEDVVFICSPLDGMFVWNGTGEAYKVDNAPHITSMALHGERLFVTVDGEKNSVWFSDDLDPTNWDSSLSGGGFIQLIDERGSLNRVISYLGYVYVFRDYGITRISALGLQSDFSVSNLFVSGGKIYPDTVALCGDTVIFLSEDGLYAFDGVSTTKILKNISPLFEIKDSAHASYGQGKYYLSFGLRGDEQESETNNAMLVLDLSSGAYSLTRGVSLIGFYPLGGEMTAVTEDGKIGVVDKCGNAFSSSLKKKWSIPKTTIGDERIKIVREIYITTKKKISIILRSDESEKVIEIEGDASPQRIKTFFEARRVGVDIVSFETGNDISRPTVCFTVRRI